MSNHDLDPMVDATLGWEHKHLMHRSPDTLEALLDEMGERGWELISVLFNTESKYVAFMRRRIVT